MANIREFIEMPSIEVLSELSESVCLFVGLGFLENLSMNYLVSNVN